MLAADSNDLKELSKVVQELGARHVEYGVLPAHFQVVETALLRTLETGLGKDNFTEDMRKSWAAVFKFLSKAMVTGSSSQIRLTVIKAPQPVLPGDVSSSAAKEEKEDDEDDDEAILMDRIVKLRLLMQSQPSTPRIVDTAPQLPESRRRSFNCVVDKLHGSPVESLYAAGGPLPDSNENPSLTHNATWAMDKPPQMPTRERRRRSCDYVSNRLSSSSPSSQEQEQAKVTRPATTDIPIKMPVRKGAIKKTQQGPSSSSTSTESQSLKSLKKSRAAAEESSNKFSSFVNSPQLPKTIWTVDCE